MKKEFSKRSIQSLTSINKISSIQYNNPFGVNSPKGN